jgi:hypothetical protein
MHSHPYGSPRISAPRSRPAVTDTVQTDVHTLSTPAEKLEPEPALLMVSSRSKATRAAYRFVSQLTQTICMPTTYGIALSTRRVGSPAQLAEGAVSQAPYGAHRTTLVGRDLLHREPRPQP